MEDQLPSYCSKVNIYVTFYDHANDTWQYANYTSQDVTGILGWAFSARVSEYVKFTITRSDPLIMLFLGLPNV